MTMRCLATRAFSSSATGRCASERARSVPAGVAAMSRSGLAAWALAVVLAFWCLGAYNRLVRLRQALGEAFAELAAVLAKRHRLIDDTLLADADRAAAAGAGARAAFDALLTCCVAMALWISSSSTVFSSCSSNTHRRPS